MLLVPPKPINTITITIMLAFTFFLIFFSSGFLHFPSVSPSLPPIHHSFTLPSINSSSDPFTDLLSSFRKWDSRVGCDKFREKTNGVLLNHSKVVSLQEFGGGCGGFELNHVSVLVKGWTWIPDNLDNLYSCRCGLSCLWTKSNVLADKPDALLFETSTPPIQVDFIFAEMYEEHFDMLDFAMVRRVGEPLRAYMDLETGRKRSGREDIYISYHAEDDVQSTYAGSLFHNGRNYHVSNTKNSQAALVLNASRRFRYTLDLKKEEEKKLILRKIRVHAQAIRAAYLFKAAGGQGQRQGQGQGQLNETTKPLQTSTGEFPIGPEQLASISREHDIASLQQYGGVAGVSNLLKTDLEKGVDGDDADLLRRRNAFSSNNYPRKKGRSFLVTSIVLGLLES
ncbi:hypothetical protein KIW84_057439 [Lathyrus oleraceus]|uniref:Calcium-transporting P-type ATPase N-terminal autoinhibitory domain-containing protein n=1 Tax=Pisum sativum TaxID=3888 RepID=A0A9D4X139_PEA|nr:hypothetical protein KIW84_057439 [Pisum sativum]